MLHSKHIRKGTGPKVSKGRRLASGDNEKTERISRNERPTAATIEAADAARRRETSALRKAIVLSKNRIITLGKGHAIRFVHDSLVVFE